jgi:hypothetical protein
MGTDAEGQSYYFGPLQKSSALGGMSWFQVAVIATCGALGVGLMRSLPSAPGMVVGLGLLGVGFAAGFVRIGGRLVEDWAFPVRYWYSGQGRRARHWERPGDGAPGTRELDAPPGLEHLKFFAVRLVGGEAGVVFDQTRGTYIGVLRCRGGAFGLVDRSDKDRLLRAWGDVLNGWCVDDESISRLQVLERTLPEDGDALAAYLDRAAAVPEHSPALASYRRLLAGAQPLSQRHETFLVLAVSQSAPAARRLGGGDLGACEALAQELVNLADRARAAEVVVEGILGPAEVVRCIRAGFDPEVAVRPGAWMPAPDRPARLGDAWPDEVTTTWSRFEAGGVCHATFWVEEWPRVPVGADFLGPLFLQSKCSRTLSIVGEAVSPARAAQEVQDARTGFLADQALRDRAGYLPTYFRQMEGQALDRREADLAAGHGEYRFSAYVTVSAPDPDSLEMAATGIVRLATQCRLRLWRLYGQQDLGFACALPLARGLR